ncbi:MAG: DUF3293 domain-containing protein [Azonexus sp.]|nr:DUF3293 domain-containing protein [Azonexus sp.]
MAKMTELEAAYRATTYRAFLPGGVMDLRVGQANEALSYWLESAGSLSFAIISAYNPGLQRLDAARNAERQSQLECDLLEGNYEPYAGENIPDDVNGPLEETCFVVDIALEDACALAEDYGQKAIVYGGVDGIPGLVWIEETEELKEK